MTEELKQLRDDLQDTFNKEPAHGNVIKKLGITNEEHPHTRILHWLLDPQQNEHGGSPVFLEKIAELGNITGLDSSTATIQTFQQQIGPQNAELDLLIRSDNTCIGVEIKTTHAEHEEKLKKELNALQTIYGKDSQLIHLTHKPTPETTTGTIITWKEVADTLHQEITAADPEWQGFLKHLFRHFKNETMENEINKLEDLKSNQLDKANFYVHTLDFIDEAESAYWKTINQFFQDIAKYVENRQQQARFTDLEAQQPSPWIQDNWYCKANDKYDIEDSNNPKALNIYNKGWPSSKDGNSHDQTTIKFDINKRGYDTDQDTTAQQLQPLTTEFGVEVNLDIISNRSKEQSQLRNEFYSHLPEENRVHLREHNYVIADEYQYDPSYHVIGKIIESSWPPTEEDINTVTNELKRLLNNVYEPVNKTLQTSNPEK